MVVAVVELEVLENQKLHQTSYTTASPFTALPVTTGYPITVGGGGAGATPGDKWMFRWLIQFFQQ